MQNKPPCRPKRTLTICALAFLLVTLTACDPDRSSGIIPGLTPDSIGINITGLPTDLQPDVTITGPGGYEQAITESIRLEELESGAYTVTAQSLELNGTPFDPNRETHQLTLEPGGSKSVSIRYAPHRAYSQAVLEHLNRYREGAGLPAVTLDAEGSLPNWLHARYMAENRTSGHEQDPSLPWHTPEGNQAARFSNVGLAFGDRTERPTWVLHMFGQAPFHLMNLLDPRTTAIRHGYYYRPAECDEGLCGSGVSASALEPVRGAQWLTGQKVHFPGDGLVIAMLAFWGENPSPASACPAAYQPTNGPLGLPIFVMRGEGQAQEIAASSLTANGAPIEHCIVGGGSDHGGSDEEVEKVMTRLQRYGATILLPLHPLEPLTTYTVTLTTGNGVETWSFQTGDVALERYGGAVGNEP